MKSVTQLILEVNKLNAENKELRKQLLASRKSMDEIKAGNIDALVVAHKKAIKIYTAPAADNSYRILVEKMQEGAVTLNKDGMILYCNSSFANMTGLPLQQVIGKKFLHFINDASRMIYKNLFKEGWHGHSQNEMNLFTTGDKVIPVLMSANILLLQNDTVLSIILTDLTPQKKRAEFKNELIEKIISVIIKINDSDEILKMNNSDYISKQLNYDYTYLANVFSEAKGISIKQYSIIHKIEKVKILLLKGELNLTEISYKMKYSSVAHLSGQFKKITGLSPSGFVQMKKKNYPPAA